MHLKASLETKQLKVASWPCWRSLVMSQQPCMYQAPFLVSPHQNCGMAQQRNVNLLARHPPPSSSEWSCGRSMRLGGATSFVHLINPSTLNCRLLSMWASCTPFFLAVQARWYWAEGLVYQQCSCPPQFFYAALHLAGCSLIIFRHS